MRKRLLSGILLLLFIVAPAAKSQSVLDAIFIFRDIIFSSASVDSYKRLSVGPSYIFLRGFDGSADGLLRGCLGICREDYFRTAKGLSSAVDIGLDFYGGGFRFLEHRYKADAWYIRYGSSLAYTHESISGPDLFVKLGFSAAYGLTGSSSYNPEHLNESPFYNPSARINRFLFSTVTGVGLDLKEKHRLELQYVHGLTPFFRFVGGRLQASSISLMYSYTLGEPRKAATDIEGFLSH